MPNVLTNLDLVTDEVLLFLSELYKPRRINNSSLEDMEFQTGPSVRRAFTEALCFNPCDLPCGTSGSHNGSDFHLFKTVRRMLHERSGLMQCCSCNRWLEISYESFDASFICSRCDGADSDSDDDDDDDDDDDADFETGYKIGYQDAVAGRKHRYK